MLHVRLVPDRVLRDVLVVHQTVADDDVHHRERQRRVAGRLDRQVPVGRFRGPGPNRIHHDDLRAPTLRLAHERPEMEVRDDRVRPPQHDVPAMDDLLRIDSGAGSNRGREACGSDRAADVAVEAATPHRPEQPHVERGLLYQSLHARRAVGQDGFGARFLDDRLPP